MRIPSSYVVIVALAAITTLLIPATADQVFSLGYVSLASGCISLVLMAAAILLATRWRWIEAPLGGLDQVYNSHKWLAIWALAFASIHLVYKAKLPDAPNIVIWQVEPFWTRSLRGYAFLGLMLTIILALNRKISYDRWRWMHRLSGPIFVVVALHWLTIKSPISPSSPLGLWLWFWVLIGTFGFSYKWLLYPLMGKRHRYRVETAERDERTLSLVLAPINTPLQFKAGNFAFLSFVVSGLREPHPFTIATAPDAQGRLRFLIRNAGDFTAELNWKAKPGMEVDVYGPYGDFVRDTSRCGPELWIAAGVGIAPFLSWLHSLDADTVHRAHLLVLRGNERFPEASALRALAGEKGVKLDLLEAGSSRHAKSERLASLIANAADDTEVYFCGPAALRDKLVKAITQRGLPMAQFHFELFDFR
ncbi:hypothetical protein JHS3_22760 [Jeongeupia sp. HS-3]|uniref:ferredoxin reductase family protein n=1 Tax=Jeongeupia sp. HS-3 TaxID=1009682 RepID=UPI0018A4612F|nr:ferredoxin reductase family protein [Jeongeupia sp. HS-3]BCL76540.1 hypothetical protein JHS3_22760 [Jeongeupia sp. HS-3]